MSGIPIETEILTRRGWKNYNDYIIGDLNIGEEIFTYDISKGETEWVPLSGVLYHGEQEFNPRFALYLRTIRYNTPKDSQLNNEYTVKPQTMPNFPDDILIKLDSSW